MKFKCSLFLLLILPFFGISQILDSLDIYDHKEYENQTLKVFSDKGLIKLQVIKANVIKINFFKTDSIDQETSNQNNGAYIRITQNLDDIFMQTDSLLIIINKLDFTIKFETLKEQIFTVNKSVLLSDTGNSFSLSTIKYEEFFNNKNKKLKYKTYKIKNIKAIYSSKKYAIYFQNTHNGYLELNSENLQIKYLDKSTSGYYFLAGSKEEMERNSKLIQIN